jgi:hypothetical protein
MAKPMTEKQYSFITKLISERVIKPEHLEKLGQGAGSFTSALASETITWLLRQPVAAAAPTVTAHAGAAVMKQPEASQGVYQKDGKIYVVKSNKAHTHTYAKELVTSADHLTEAGTVIPFDLTYAPGVVKTLTEADRMPLADAEQLMIKFGRCICCGRTLKAAKSVSQGIGPICIKYFAA